MRGALERARQHIKTIRVLSSLLILAAIFLGCSQPTRQVVLYTSQDQFYAEPILADFTKETGIQVLPVFDTESAKTAALANRLRAEKRNPQCDVFWSNEEMHGRLLALEQVLISDELVKLGFRTRQLAINTTLLKASDAPKSLRELTDPKWKGKIALAYPLFGTTSFHFLALRVEWGDPAWRDWCAGLIRNEAKIVDGNSVVVKLVGAGECVIGLTDSDDIAAGKRQGLPIEAAPSLKESVVIGNTIAVVQRAPHRAEAKILADYLGRHETLKKLVNLGAIDGIQPVEGPSIRIEWTDPLANLDEMNEILKAIFLRS